MPSPTSKNRMDFTVRFFCYYLFISIVDKILYKTTISLRNRNLLLEEIAPIGNLEDARDALCTSIEEAIKSSTLTLDDCQSIVKVINHAPMGSGLEF